MMGTPLRQFLTLPLKRSAFDAKSLKSCSLIANLTRRQFATKTAENASPIFAVQHLDGDLEGVVVFAMNKPDTKNAISKAMLKHMQDAVRDTKYSTAARVVIIRSLVPNAFCTGADLKERVKMSPEEVPQFVDAARGLMDDLENLPQPIIASIDGFALGGGLEMALACDLRVASDSAKLGLTETRLAIIPGAGGTQRLPRLIGASAAKELIFSGRLINCQQAHQFGMVNRVVAQTEQGDAAFQGALTMAKDMLLCGPIALRQAKQAINRGVQCDIQSGLAIEKLCYAQVIPTKDRLEALQAFRDKRPPKFMGH